MELNCILRTYGAKGEGKSSEMVIQLCVPLVLLNPEDHTELARLKMESAVKAIIKPLQLAFVEEGDAQPDLPADLFSRDNEEDRDTLIETVMRRHDLTRAEAIEHIEELAKLAEAGPDPFDEPEPENLAVVGKFIKHKQGQVVYKVQSVTNGKVVLADAVIGTILSEKISLANIERFYEEVEQEPALVQA